MSKIPFYLVTGFLGSGKTTFLKRMLSEYGTHKRIAIVQNEFAPVGVDGADLKQEGANFEILEINNGSVFCACLLGNFIESLEKFISEISPEIIILEASGLSDPGNICEVISNGNLVEKVFLAQNITIIDAVNFIRAASKLERVMQQVRIADSVIINKTDKVSGTDLAAIKEEVKSLNPFAKIYETTYCKSEFKLEPAFKLDTSIGQKQPATSSPRPDIDTWVVKMHKQLNTENFREFIKKWGDTAFRIKGFVGSPQGTIAVQSCFTDVEFIPSKEFKGVSQLIVLGKGIDRRAFMKDLRESYE